MKLKELFTQLATRSGITEGDANLKAAIDAIPDFDVNDDGVANVMVKNLITEAEAGSRPTLKNKYFAEALNGVDALLDPALADFLEPDEIAALKGDKATTKKLTALIQKAKTKAAAGNSAEAAKAISDLNKEVERLKTEKENDTASLRAQHAEERFYDRIGLGLAGRTDVIDLAKAKDGIRVTNDFRDTLKAMGGVIDVTTNKIMQAGDKSLPLYVDNKEVTVDSVLTKTLTENGYIKKSETAPQSIVTVPAADDNKAKVSTAATNTLTAISAKLKAKNE